MPTTTLLYASVLGLLMIVISVRVMLRRRAQKISLGDGGDVELLARGRAFGNFVEYVPMALILMGLIEMSGGSKTALNVFGAVLVASRTSHAFGITAGTMTTPQRLCRQIGMAGTWIVLLSLCAYGVLLALG